MNDDVTIHQTSYFSWVDSKKVDEYILQKDFERLIKDSNLFWLSFCKTFSSYQKSDGRTDFQVLRENEHIECSGTKIAIDTIKKIMEQFRKILTAGIRDRTNIRLLQTSFSFRPSSYIFTLDNLGSNRDITPIRFEIPDDWYNLIEPVLPYFIENCGAAYKNDPTENSTDSVIQINWKDRLIYPISSLPIPLPKPIGHALYPLYQNQEYCDFTISYEDGMVIKSHFALLYAYGGSVLQKLLTSHFKEGREKAIAFETHRKEIIEAFLEFIYLGGKEFSEKMILSNDLDITKLYNLFTFAHMYEVETLINCCTNLISLKATKEDLREIKELASLYNNEHLKELCNYFSCEQKLNLVKV